MSETSRYRGRLMRPSRGKMIAGVARGLSDYFGVGVTPVRLTFVAFGLFGPGEVAYLILWLIMPKTRV